MSRRTVARWESRGGAHFFELYADRFGYGYTANRAGGGLPALSNDESAIAYVERPTSWGRWVDQYQPHANTTPMRRVKVAA